MKLSSFPPSLAAQLVIIAAGQVINVPAVENKSEISDTRIFSVANTSLPEVDLALEIPQTRPYLHTYLEYIIDFLFHRPMIDTPGQSDPLNSYLRPPNMRFCQCGIASNRVKLNFLLRQFLTVATIFMWNNNLTCRFTGWMISPPNLHSHGGCISVYWAITKNELVLVL